MTTDAPADATDGAPPAASPVPSALSRRHAVCGAALLGLGVPLLAACGGDGGSSADSGDAAGGSGGGADGGDGSGMSGALAATSDIPEGGGVVFADEGVVVTQPTAGEFRAFSTTCTHQGCAVNEVDDAIICPCHASTFSLEDGSPQGGPADGPLAEVPIRVEGDQVVLG